MLCVEARIATFAGSPVGASSGASFSGELTSQVQGLVSHPERRVLFSKSREAFFFHLCHNVTVMALFGAFVLAVLSEYFLQ